MYVLEWAAQSKGAKNRHKTGTIVSYYSATICTGVHTTQMEFEWDPAKAESNLEKHGISFVAAAKMLQGPHVRIPSHRGGEVRYLGIGELNGRILTVVYTMRQGRYRIISARRARTNEEAAYRTFFDSGD